MAWKGALSSANRPPKTMFVYHAPVPVLIERRLSRIGR
jgi:hypothetical protein